MPRLSARLHLLYLIAAATVPLWLFAAYLLVQYTLSERARFEREAVQVARQVSLVVEAELGNMFTVLESLTKSQAATNGDLEALYLDAQRLTTPGGRVVFLQEVGGAELFDTQLPFGAELPQAPAWSPGEIKRLRSGQRLVSDVFANPLTGEYRIAVATALSSPRNREWLLAITIPTARLRDVMMPAAPEGWIVAIGDSVGRYVARSQKHEEMTGKAGLPEYLGRIVGPSGTFTSANFEGATLLAGYYRSSFSELFYTANIPLSRVQLPLWNSLKAIAVAGLAAAAFSVALAYFVGKKFAFATRELAARAQALGEGRPVAPLSTRVREFGMIADSMMAAEKALAERTGELEAVLETVPVAVWFTYDPRGREVIRNRFAAELMGLTEDDRRHFGRPDHVIDTTALKDGQPVSREDRPLTKAMRGEQTDNEEFAYILPSGVRRVLLTSARSIRDAAGRVVGGVQVSLDITERKRGEEHRRLLVKELNHRVKNTLAVVQSIANQTLRGATDLSDATTSLTGRLIALAKTHDILTQENWDGADLEEVVIATLEPHAYLARFEIAGPTIRLRPSLALALSMALHELATNAIKYGALSNSAGSVRISWAVARAENRPKLRFEWSERDGPEVAESDRRGFGMRLLKRVFSSEPGGRIDIQLPSTGLVAVFEADLEAADIGKLASADAEAGRTL